MDEVSSIKDWTCLSHQKASASATATATVTTVKPSATATVPTVKPSATATVHVPAVKPKYILEKRNQRVKRCQGCKIKFLQNDDNVISSYENHPFVSKKYNYAMHDAWRNYYYHVSLDCLKKGNPNIHDNKALVSAWLKLEKLQ